MNGLEFLKQQDATYRDGRAVVWLENTGDNAVLLRQQNLYWKEGYDTFQTDATGVFMELAPTEVESNLGRYRRDASERIRRPASAKLPPGMKESGGLLIGSGDTDWVPREAQPIPWPDLGLGDLPGKYMVSFRGTTTEEDGKVTPIKREISFRLKKDADLAAPLLLVARALNHTREQAYAGFLNDVPDVTAATALGPSALRSAAGEENGPFDLFVHPAQAFLAERLWMDQAANDIPRINRIISSPHFTNPLFWALSKAGTEPYRVLDTGFLWLISKQADDETRYTVLDCFATVEPLPGVLFSDGTGMVMPL